MLYATEFELFWELSFLGWNRFISPFLQTMKLPSLLLPYSAGRGVLESHHWVSVVSSACSRARREQGPLQASFGMRGGDLGLGHQQTPRSR